MKLVLLCVLLLATTVRAEPRSAAETAFIKENISKVEAEALALVDLGNYKQACDKLQIAEKAATILFQGGTYREKLNAQSLLEIVQDERETVCQQVK